MSEVSQPAEFQREGNLASEKEAEGCKHCGSALPAGRSVYCCRGCEVVYQVIHDVGLGEYYSLLRDEGHRAVEPGDYSYFDDPLFLERFTTSASTSPDTEIRSVTFFLPGIHCAACIWLLEQLPQVESSLRSARVDFARNTVRIVYNAHAIKLSSIGALLASVGYPPLPSRDSDIEKQRRSLHRRALIRLGVAAVCLMNIMMLAVSLYEGDQSGIPLRYHALFAWVSLLLCVPPVVYCAQPFYQSALGGIRSGVLHIDLPISLALIGAFTISFVNVVLGRPDIYFDSIAAVIFLLLAGRMFQQRTVARVLDSVTLLAAFTPQSARRIRGDEEESVYIGAVLPGDVLRVGASEVLPVDGVLVSCEAFIDNAVLTGESEPEHLTSGAKLFAGARNVGEGILVKTESVGETTRLGSILAHVQNGARSRAPIERLLDRLGRRFTFVVLALSVVSFVAWLPVGVGVAADRVLALLIVSCPCAIALATPLAFAVSVGRAARAGFLIKGADVIERLAQVSFIYFDKTGTLTEGKIAIESLDLLAPERYSRERIAAAVGELERGIEHPIAKALTRWCGASGEKFSEQSVIQGRGVSGRDQQGRLWQAGSASWLEQCGVLPLSKIDDTRSTLGVACEGELVAWFVLADTLRSDAPEMLEELAQRGVEVGILSGDRSGVVARIAELLGVQSAEAFGELSPEQKKSRVAEKCLDNGIVAMVGDGVNDVLALHEAHVGIGVSGGAESCLRTADVYVTHPGLRPVLELLQGAKRAMGVVRRNLIISAAYNIAGSALAMFGYIGPLEAAILMPLSSITVVLNSTYGASFNSERRLIRG